jgi:hypothetical protein
MSSAGCELCRVCPRCFLTPTQAERLMVKRLRVNGPKVPIPDFRVEVDVLSLKKIICQSGDLLALNRRPLK